MPRLERLAALLLAQRRVAAAYWADSTLNVSQIVASLPESAGLFLGSPSIVRMSNGALLTSHDTFGSCHGPGCANRVYTFSSSDNGTTWSPAGSASPMYWATLFVREGDEGVYLMGASGDGNGGPPAQVVISRSADYGLTWAPSVALTSSSVSYSTGPTPVLSWAGRLWRAVEHNVGPGGWGVGYASLVLSAPSGVGTDLLSPASWALSGELPFASVAHLVPPSWSREGVVPGYGWLEGGPVEPPGSNDTGIFVMLRVNSQPTANKAALLRLDSGAPGAPLTFVSWVDPFPGGMSKFDVKRDPVSGLYVTLSNDIQDDSVSLPPTCSYVTPPAPPRGNLSCCGFIVGCDVGGGTPSCVWCRAGARANLTLAVSPSPGGPWTVVSPILWDDTGVPKFVSEMGTGFQYASFAFDGGDIISAVRAGYRGSVNYHNANRNLFKRVPDWRSLPAVEACRAGVHP